MRKVQLAAAAQSGRVATDCCAARLLALACAGVHAFALSTTRVGTGPYLMLERYGRAPIYEKLQRLRFETCQAPEDSEQWTSS